MTLSLLPSTLLLALTGVTKELLAQFLTKEIAAHAGLSLPQVL
jgi:hypothetical protein